MSHYKILMLSIFICNNLNILSSSKASPLSKNILVHNDNAQTLFPLFINTNSSPDDDEKISINALSNNTKISILSSSPSVKEDDIKDVTQKIKAAGILTLTAITTAGVVHLKQSLEQDSMRTRRSFLPDINAGDIFGAGGVAQGAGNVVKGMALLVAAGGIVYTLRKYFGLIDARFEAQEEKSKAERELALRQQRDELMQNVKVALKEQQDTIEQNNNAWAQDIRILINQNRKDSLGIFSPLMQSVGSLSNAIKQEKERNHKRLIPLVNGLSLVAQILEESKITSNATAADATLKALLHNAAQATTLNNSGNSSPDAATAADEKLHQAQDALSLQAHKLSEPIGPPARPASIIIGQTDKTCCSSCFS